jgi:hypothetical protein
MKDKRIKTQINRGNALIQLGIAMAVVLIATPVGLSRYTNYLDEQTWGVTASHLTTVSQGSRRYIGDNYDALLNQVKGGATVTIIGQTLRDKGYLPPGFSLKNNDGQNYVLSIARNPQQTDKMVAFVLTTGGTQMAFKEQRYVSQNVTGLGGYIEPANVANGAGGGWQVNLSNFGLSAQAGHLAAYLSSEVLGTSAEESDRLYRFQVNGRPDLNKMHTSIDMGGNDLNAANTVNATNGKFQQSVTGQSGSFTANLSANNNVTAGQNIVAGGGVTANSDIRTNGGWLVTKNDKGWYSEDHGGGLYMSDNDTIRSLNDKNIYTGGQVQGGTVRANNRLSGGEYLQLDGMATAGAACSNHTVGLDNTGAILSCQAGVWKSSSTVGSLYTSPDVRQGQSINIGQHQYCALSQARFDYNNYRGCILTPNAGGTWTLTAAHVGNGQADCVAVCF